MDLKTHHLSVLTQQESFDFTSTALALFRFQAQHNTVYKEYVQNLRIKTEEVKSLQQIPFLPIEFFKEQEVKTGDFEPEATFYSSGTTKQARSRHFVSSLRLYHQVSERIFEHFYGPLQEYVVLALLPSYLEQGGSSLVAMVDHFIKKTAQPEEGFFLRNHTGLLQALRQARGRGKKVLLMGVSYALLDLAEELQGKEDFTGVTVMETGGMKGRRREMIREELHAQLKRGFGVPAIHSEYGMTELLSQGYSQGEGVFWPGYTMRILLRDLNDPFDMSGKINSGGINVIDLANVDSCAFIETKDIGRLHPEGSFEVLGRFDNSDIRGCNLLVS
ncbi:acyl-CoA synthetase family protein [Pontibacter mangrovi]|uniref:Long-chain fatty acid--CoA ligase n=1 Tax=Pontibacter mangrovi TaxID=2589816 RepID=A0A501W204_9BACT|nr:long-chain fatty acid--CoA ligase [Pontibacter mangrovi]TPE43288.1 long-chain fatty acid--CoA ligase [Pontibacter mangrovi]